MSEQRANVRVVAGEGERVDVDPPVRSPEETPGVMESGAGMPPPPPQELEPQIGGPAVQSPGPANVAAATGGGLADQMRAAFESMDSTEEFGVPGWTRPDGKPSLILVARTFGDRKQFTEGLANEVFIAKSTHKLFWVDDQGVRQEIQGGWGKGLAELLGLRVDKAADLVAMVISKPDPSNPGVRIPNVPGIGSLATQIINWASQSNREAEESLGE